MVFHVCSNRKTKVAFNSPKEIAKAKALPVIKADFNNGSSAWKMFNVAKVKKLVYKKMVFSDIRVKLSVK